MGVCDVCGNEYDDTFTLTTAQGATYTFDSFECAIHRVAPTCANCECTVIGHGIQAHEQIYCCAHCADVHGVRNVSDNAEHPPTAGVPTNDRPGAETPGAVPPGAVPPGAVPPGTIPPGTVPPGGVPPMGV